MPYDPHGALCIGQGSVWPGAPAFARQSVEEDESRKPAGRQPAGHFIAFLVDYDPFVPTAGRDEDGGSIGPVWPEHRHARLADPMNSAIRHQRIGRAFIYCFDKW